MKSTLAFLLSLPLLSLSAPTPQEAVDAPDDIDAAAALPASTLYTDLGNGYINLTALPNALAWPLRDRQHNALGVFYPLDYIPNFQLQSRRQNQNNLFDTTRQADTHGDGDVAGQRVRWPPSPIRTTDPQLVIDGVINPATGLPGDVSWLLVWSVAEALLGFYDSQGLDSYKNGIQFTVIDLNGVAITGVSTNGPQKPPLGPPPGPGVASDISQTAK